MRTRSPANEVVEYLGDAFRLAVCGAAIIAELPIVDHRASVWVVCSTCARSKVDTGFSFLSAAIRTNFR